MSLSITFMHMIGRSYCFGILVLVCLLASCSDPAGTPPDDGMIENDPDTSFAVIAAIPDTLYADEYAWIQTRELDAKKSNLKLFIHTVQCTIDSITGDRIHFRIPDNAERGRVRLYKFDTIEAKGTIFINALPRRIGDFKSQFNAVDPLHGYVGDLVRVHCQDVPLRKKDVSVSIGDVQFETISLSPTDIVVRVPQNAKSGPMKVRMFYTTWPAGDFTVHSGGQKLLKENTLSRVLIHIMNLNVVWEIGTIEGSDTSRRTMTIKYDVHTDRKDWAANILRTGDSIIVDEERDFASFRETLEIRLRVDQTENRVYGTIRLINTYTGNAGQIITSYTLDGLRYYDNNGSYEFKAINEEIGKYLKGITYTYSLRDQYSILTEYLGPADNADFNLTLECVR